MDLTTLLTYALTALAIELTPGPNMVWLAIVAVRDGRRARFAAVAGVGVGLALLGVAAALGLGALIAGQPIIVQMLRWAGVAYLLWLAWDGWRAADDGMGDGLDGGVAPGSSLWRYVVDGVVTNLLNPKAFLFYLGVLPAFLTAQSGIADALTLTAVYVGVATVIHAGIVALAATARDWLTASGKVVVVRRALALALVAVALWVVWKA